MQVRDLESGRTFTFVDDPTQTLLVSRGNGWYNTFVGYSGGPWVETKGRQVVATIPEVNECLLPVLRCIKESKAPLHVGFIAKGIGKHLQATQIAVDILIQQGILRSDMIPTDRATYAIDSNTPA